MSLSGLFLGPPPDSKEEVEDDAKRAQDTLVFAACVGLIDGTDRLKTREGYCWKALHDNGKKRSTRSATVVERSGAVGVAILVLGWVCMQEASVSSFFSFFLLYS